MVRPMRGKVSYIPLRSRLKDALLSGHFCAGILEPGAMLWPGSLLGGTRSEWFVSPEDIGKFPKCQKQNLPDKFAELSLTAVLYGFGQ